MAFLANKVVSGADVKYGLMDNSQNLDVGEVIIPGVTSVKNVVLTGGNTAAGLLGVVLAIVGPKGKVLELNSKAVAGDNVTVGLIQVAYFPLYIHMEWRVDLSAAAETTGGSGTYGTFKVDSTGLLLLESDVTGFGTVSSKQFFSFGLTGASDREVTCRYIRGGII